MIVTLLMGFLADLVFNSASSMRRGYRADMDRYVSRRGLRSDSPRPTAR
jgi:hypothetical protein